MPINYINPPMMDETGKAIVAVLTGEEPEESSGPVSLIKAPMSEATAQSLLAAIQNMPKLPALDDSFKAALLDCFAHVAWTNEHGQDYYDALEAALYPPVGLVSISAVYTQSGTIYNTDSLDSLRGDLVVTATYADNTVRTVTDYTLSGTLTPGTSTITVSYGGKTTTFDVTVTESTIYTLTENDFLRGYGTTGTYGPEPHYAGAANDRISYNKFDLLLEAGKRYVVEATATSAYKDSAQMGLQYFNQKALDSVAINGIIDTRNIDTTTGWGNLSVTITVPATINNSPTRGARITFRQSSANPSISSDFRITSLTISEVSA